MIASTPGAFRRAADAYLFEGVTLDPQALAAARAAVEAARLLVVGEIHGVRETAAVLYALALQLGTRGLAFEWSHEELDAVVRDFVAGERFDLERLWSLPRSAELFCGDGRFTAGHVALLERLRNEGRLDQVICYDRLDPEPPPHPGVRDRELAQRLLEQWDRTTPLLLVVGAGHAQLGGANGGTMADHLAARLSGLQPAVLDFAGECWFRGEAHRLSGPRPHAPIVFRLPAATPAVVPGPAAVAAAVDPLPRRTSHR